MSHFHPPGATQQAHIKASINSAIVGTLAHHNNRLNGLRFRSIDKHHTELRIYGRLLQGTTGHLTIVNHFP